MTENGRRRPWYAVAIAGGFGAVLGVAYLIAPKAEHAVIPPALAAPVAVPVTGPDEAQRWRERMEQKMNDLAERLARIEGKLEQR